MVAGMSHASMCVSNSGTATSSTGSPTRATPGTSTAACMRARTPQRSTRRVSRRPRGGGAEGTSPGVQKSRTGTQIQDSNTHTGVQESRTSGQQYKYRTAIQIQKSKSPGLQESRLGDIAPRRNAGDRTEGSMRGLARVFARCLCLESMSPGLQECRTPRVLDGSVARAIYHQHACVNTHLYSHSADT